MTNEPVDTVSHKDKAISPDVPTKMDTQHVSSRSGWQIIKSILAGLFGIQSEKNREADFKQGKPSDFIIYGIIGVIALVITMIVIVKQVIT